VLSESFQEFLLWNGVRELQADDYNKSYFTLLNELSHSDTVPEEKFLETFTQHSNSAHRHTVYIIEDTDKSKIVGSATLITEDRLDGQRYGRIEDVVVDSSYRGKNLGKLLLQKLVSVGKEEKLNFLALNCKPELMGFYGKFGFESVGTQMVKYIQQQSQEEENSNNHHLLAEMVVDDELPYAGVDDVSSEWKDNFSKCAEWSDWKAFVCGDVTVTLWIERKYLHECASSGHMEVFSKESSLSSLSVALGSAMKEAKRQGCYKVMLDCGNDEEANKFIELGFAKGQCFATSKLNAM